MFVVITIDGKIIKKFPNIICVKSLIRLSYINKLHLKYFVKTFFYQTINT